jgi:hypothetical protein
MGRPSWARHQRGQRQRAALVPHELVWRGHGMSQQPPVTESRALICVVVTTAVVGTLVAVVAGTWLLVSPLVA